MSKTDGICQEYSHFPTGFEKQTDCPSKLQSNFDSSSVFGGTKKMKLWSGLFCVLLASTLLPQTNENESGLEAFDTTVNEIEGKLEFHDDDIDRSSNAPPDVGPLGLIEQHAPAVLNILEDPKWQELDEVGRYRVLVPQLRITWGLERDSSQKLIETLTSIDHQIAKGKQKRLTKNAKRILGQALDTLFHQFSRGLEWIVLRDELWKNSELWDAIPPETRNLYLDCLETCKSRLFGCFAQSESNFDTEVIGELEAALSDPVEYRDLVRKWRSRDPFAASTDLIPSMINCNQNFLNPDAIECDRIIAFGTTDPAAKVEWPEESASQLNPGSSQDESLGDSSLGEF